MCSISRDTEINGSDKGNTRNGVAYIHLTEDSLARRGKTMEMVAGAHTLFYAKEWPGPMGFIRDRNGRITHLVSHEDKDYLAKKLE